MTAPAIDMSASSRHVERPAIPRAFYEPTTLGTVGLLLYGPFLFLAPACLSVAIWKADAPLLLRIALTFPLTVVSGYGLQLMAGVIGHDGTHLALSRHSLLSTVLGVFYASAAVTYLEMGFALQHWEHHRFTNQASDPDIRTLAHLKRWWQRILLTRVTFNWGYLKIVLGEMFGRPYASRYPLPFSRTTIRALCWLNVGFALLWLAAFAAVAAYDPVAGVFVVALPSAVVFVVSAAEGFLNHAGTPGTDVFYGSRSRTSPIFTALFAGANFHLEHHLYPGVPCYRLPRLHRWLKRAGVYEQMTAAIEPSYLGAYINHLDSEYEVKGGDSDFDPFRRAAAPR